MQEFRKPTDIALTDLLQLAALQRRNLAVDVESADADGVLHVHDGEVVHAEYGDLVGTDAAVAMLANADVSYRFCAESVGPAERTMAATVQHLLLEAARLTDEGQLKRPTRRPVQQAAERSSVIPESAPRVTAMVRSLRRMLVPALLVGGVITAALLRTARLEEDETRLPSPAPLLATRAVDVAELGASDRRPEPVNTVRPRRPDVEIALTPTIVVRLLVSSSGTVEQARVLHPRPELNEFEQAAMHAASATRFRPAQRAGLSVPVWLNWPVSFSQAHTEQAKIRVKGSNTIGAAAGPALAAAYGREQGVDVIFEALGSSTAFGGLFDGSADIGASSRSATARELAKARSLGIELDEYVIGYDGVAVIVHPSNPLSSLTLAHARALFAGEVRTWEALDGGTPGVVLPYGRPPYSGTHDLFKAQVLRAGDSAREDEFADTVRSVEDTGDLVARVASEPTAIGYVGLAAVSNRVKVLGLSRSEQGKPVYPGEESVRDGTYPISRPLLLYTRRGTSQHVSDFVQFVLSPSGKNILEQHGLVAAESAPQVARADTARRESSRELLRVYFPNRSTKLSGDSQTALRDLARKLRTSRERLVIVGHADAAGTAARNHDVARRRAEMVRELITSRGIAPERVSVLEDAASQPLASNDAEAGRELNRRVDVHVLPP
jgi:phosphate binding protein